jgi:2-keto-3-deoxy-L-rhamnonate aldolase RhmA
MTGSLREAIAAGRTTIGSWVTLAHPGTAEVMAASGFDWLVIDVEHGGYDLETATALIRAMQAVQPSCQPLVRITQNDTLEIRRCLDAGAYGVIVPMINTREAAQQAVAAAHYPPKGVRGYGFTRANRYGTEFAPHLEWAEREHTVVVQIEHVEAVEHIDEIVSVEGVDCAFVGPWDLSGSMGLPGQLDHPRVTSALERVVACCGEHGKAAGLLVTVPTPEAIAAASQRGFTFLALGVDALLLAHRCQEIVAAARQAAG